MPAVKMSLAQYCAVSELLTAIRTRYKSSQNQALKLLFDIIMWLKWHFNFYCESVVHESCREHMLICFYYRSSLLHFSHTVRWFWYVVILYVLFVSLLSNIFIAIPIVWRPISCFFLHFCLPFISFVLNDATVCVISVYFSYWLIDYNLIL